MVSCFKERPEGADRQDDRYSSQFENNFFTEMCSSSEAGSYLRLIDFVYHSTLGLKVIKKEKKIGRAGCCRAKTEQHKWSQDVGTKNG